MHSKYDLRHICTDRAKGFMYLAIGTPQPKVCRSGEKARGTPEFRKTVPREFSEVGVGLDYSLLTSVEEAPSKPYDSSLRRL